MSTPKTYTQAEMDAAVAKALERKITVKISPKRAIQVNGMGRWPVTLYKSQWQRLLSPTVTAQIVALYPQAADRDDSPAS